MSLRAIADVVAIHKNAFADANKFIMTGLLRFARNDKRRLPRSPRNDNVGGHASQYDMVIPTGMRTYIRMYRMCPYN